VLVCLSLTGCGLARAFAPPPQDEVTVLTTETGAKYVHVASGARSSPEIVHGKWKRAARKTCRGDYVVISEDRTERRTGGQVRGRTHEGYVRCVDPEPSLDG
jgi:hypothetical protein